MEHDPSRFLIHASELEICPIVLPMFVQEAMHLPIKIFMGTRYVDAFTKHYVYCCLDASYHCMAILCNSFGRCGDSQTIFFLLSAWSP